MIHATVFFNNCVFSQGNNSFMKRSGSMENGADVLAVLGSLSFHPIRFLFDGDAITIATEDGHEIVKHETIDLSSMGVIGGTHNFYS